MGTRLKALRVSTPDGWVDVAMDRLASFEMVPFPAIGVMQADGTIKRYLNFPVETVEEIGAVEVVGPVRGSIGQ